MSSSDTNGDSFGDVVPQDATILPTAVGGYQTEGLDPSNTETRIIEASHTAAPEGEKHG